MHHWILVGFFLNNTADILTNVIQPLVLPVLQSKLWLCTRVSISEHSMKDALANQNDPGYLIPPWKMHPWLKWLIWINPVQYAFEALMANEFHNLDIQCEPPYIVPAGPNASPGHQSCALQGSSPDNLTVKGSEYIQTTYTYTRAHLWRNFGIIIAWFIFFVALTMLGMEIQKPNKGGSSVTIFKRGEAPKAVEDAIEHIGPPVDEESAGKNGATPELKDEQANERVQDIAKNTSIFTWQNVNYTIPYKGGQRKLLQDVHGYVKPGRLTAMVGASGAG